LIEGAGAEGGQAGRKRLLLALALVLVFASLAAIACVVLALGVEPRGVRVPEPLDAEMVQCPAAGEHPAGDPGLYVDRFEVTVRDYREFLDATGRKLPKGATLWTDPAGTAFMPATGVTLHDARVYAAWRGKRLPTSAEWEWAARGPNGFEYPWGEGFIETTANTAELDLRRPTIVGTFYNGRSLYSGAYDMVGNVAEWTESQVARAVDTKYIIRGGSFRTSGLGAMDAPPAAGTPEASVAFGNGESGGFSEKAEGWSNDVGFRCVVGAESVVRDARLRAELARLGGRDPLRLLFQVRPALAALSVPEAGNLLRRALALEQEPLVRGRIEAALRAGGK
jgi:hypothetical protein